MGAIKSLCGNEAYRRTVALERARSTAGLKEEEVLTDRLDKGLKGRKGSKISTR